MNQIEPQTADAKASTHIAYQVTDGATKSYWTRVGIAWVNQDGKGFNIQLQSMPLNGKITLRVASEAK